MTQDAVAAKKGPEALLQDLIAKVQAKTSEGTGKPFKVDEVTVSASLRLNDGTEVRVTQPLEVCLIKVDGEGNLDTFVIPRG